MSADLKAPTPVPPLADDAQSDAIQLRAALKSCRQVHMDTVGFYEDVRNGFSRTSPPDAPSTAPHSLPE